MFERESIGSVSLVRQGKHRFYSFTMLSDLLAGTCFVINRDEDPKEGFQRELDEKRAAEIATYIDNGLGTIPSSIVLSAQPECDFQYDSKKKSVSFYSKPKAFLIIDGQHRVYGFRMAKTALRVPVVVYQGLSKRDETRLFIDINSKQKGVPPELLLDIKKLAEYENDKEQFLRTLFDLFSEENDSALYGMLSPSKRLKGMVTRSVFNTALKPLVKNFGSKSPEEVYGIYNAYLVAILEGVLVPNGMQEVLVNTTAFKAIAAFFPVVTSRVQDRFGPIYKVDNFFYFTKIVGNRINPSIFTKSKNAYIPIVEHLENSLKVEFTL